MSRDALLEGLDAARASFLEAFAGVPGEAMAFLKPGDDYALGGIVTHTTTVIEHYRTVLAAVVGGGFQAVRPEDPPGFWESSAARARDGLGPGDVADAF